MYHFCYVFFVNAFLLLSQIFLFMYYMMYLPVVPRGGLTERVVHDQLPITYLAIVHCTPQQGCFWNGGLHTQHYFLSDSLI